VRIPATITGLRLFTFLFGLTAVIWIALEGNLVQTVLLGAWASLVAAGRLWQRYLAGRLLSTGHWLLALTATGMAVGLLAPLLTLIFMVMKSGLHAHGPEFSPAAVAWVIRQTPLWAIGGGLACLGAGLLALARR
jgi:hypothetical protein